jgi:hypothetical protein
VVVTGWSGPPVGQFMDEHANGLTWGQLAIQPEPSVLVAVVPGAIIQRFHMHVYTGDGGVPIPVPGAPSNEQH